MPSTIRSRIASHTPAGLKRLLRSLWRGNRATMPTPARKRDEWAISVYRGSSPFCLAPADPAHDPVLTKNDVSDIFAGYVADPFMLRVDGTWYMFFEVVNELSKKGEIGLATSSNGLRWNYRQIVLDEPFHLSYPYVFQWHDEFFMVPESCQTNSIRLYRADSFPWRWSFVTPLIDSKDYVDPSLVHFGDKWWLFASSGKAPRRAEYLHLFSADELTGPWREHPKSPVVKGDAAIARPGGRVFVLGNHVIRYTQDCASTYGRQVRAFEITEMTEDTFAERLVSDEPILQPSAGGWTEMGMHHIDPHLLEDGSWLACVDGWRWNTVPGTAANT